MEEILQGIANVGFPIVVAAYLLVRIEGKLDELTISIHQLAWVVGEKLDAGGVANHATHSYNCAPHRCRGK